MTPPDAVGCVRVVVVVSWVVFLLVPLAVASAVSWVVASRRPASSGLAIPALVVTSVTGWLVLVGMIQHETPCGLRSAGCPTVYGYDAPVADDHPLGLAVLVAGFIVPAAWAGWRRLAPPVATGFSLTIGPMLLAGWTAPRGDGDGLWVLVFLGLPMLGVLAGLVAMVAGTVSATSATSAKSRDGGDQLVIAMPSERLTALAIDAGVIGAVLALPLSVVSHGGREVHATLAGVVVATIFLAIPLVRKGRTLGQSRLGLVVLDEDTGRPVSAVRAVLRSVIVVLEVVGIPTMVFAVPALLEYLAASQSGRSLTDRALGTVVMSRFGAPAFPPYDASAAFRPPSRLWMPE